MFYKETNFRETPIGRIPKDWAITKLESICEKVRAGGTPLTSKKEYWNGDLPFVKIEDITLAGKYLTETQSFISEEGLNNSSAWLVPENSLLFAMYGSMGEVAINKIPVTTNQAILGIIPKERDDIEFLYYWFSFFKPRWKKYAKPTTQANLTAEILRNSLIPLPSYNERKAIAEVLSVVDSAIELVDKIIWKTERLKKALMQTLLTRGIGHKEFKETEIGKIPKTWEIVKLQDVAEIRGNKSVNNFEKIAFIPMELVPDSQIFTQYEIRAKEDIKSATYCEAGDLLLAKITPSLENGKQGIVPFDIPNKIALATTEVFPIYCKQIDRFFLFYVLKFSKFRNKIIASMIGTTGRQRVPRESVERLEIPLPPVDEQQKIAEILSNIDKKLELDRNEKARLERIKQGLMDLLLTGKVRVKVD
ncbi:MAG: restriction endonuclease subunit S [Nitrososphaeria archaeon]